MADELIPVQPGAVEMATMNVTWAGANGDLPDLVPYNSTDGDLKQMATEAIRDGYIPGIGADANADLGGFMVDRFPAEGGLPNRLFMRPKTPFGL